MKPKIKPTYKQRYELEKSLNKYHYIMFVGILFIVCGISLNYTVIRFNDCRMPVYQVFVDIADADEYFSFWDKSEVNYFYLTDRFRVGEGNNSLGDFSMFLGGFILLFNLYNLLMRKWTKKYGKTIK